MRFRKLKKNRNTTDKKEPKKLTYAPYSSRVKAFITDLFMIYVPILYLITYVAMNGKDDFQSSQLAPLIGVSVYGVIYAFLLSKFGQTPGKKAYEMRVVNDTDGNNISFLKAIMRFIAFLFTATTILGLLLPFYRKDKKALHDLVCKTIVVIEKK
ncbi:MAG: RDD family protein [Sulfurimonas sp.]|uniref:RDD family protein n=1 Tax=Sulfurimonas sp. TaxID=2022749 RepID=UPI0025E1CDDD|nr:RDD family protein [Sulfurimonas sp.]MCK9454508.1 RDD family protein [Sulfurimonas sp.]